MHKKSKKLSTLGFFLIGMSVVSFVVFYITTMFSNKGYTYIDPASVELVQMEEIPEGAPTAIITTSLGEIRAVLYPDYAPVTTAQFIRLANEGYYDNTCIFDTRANGYFAAGSKDSTSSLPDNARSEQEKNPLELHQNLWSFRGALCAMNTSVDTSFTKRLYHNETYYSGSRFMILDSIDFSDADTVQQFREASASEDIADAFLTYGGVPNLSQQVTIFGQTYAGFDVITAICNVQAQAETNGAGFTPPTEEIRILSVRIGEYGSADAAVNELQHPAEFDTNLPETTQNPQGTE